MWILHPAAHTALQHWSIGGTHIPLPQQLVESPIGNTQLQPHTSWVFSTEQCAVSAAEHTYHRFNYCQLALPTQWDGHLAAPRSWTQLVHSITSPHLHLKCTLNATWFFSRHTSLPGQLPLLSSVQRCLSGSAIRLQQKISEESQTGSEQPKNVRRGVRSHHGLWKQISK